MCTQRMRHIARISKMGGLIKNMANLQETMRKIRDCGQLYAVMSLCTQMPFVYCDPETYDDEVFVYFDKDEAEKGARWLLEKRNPIQLARIDKKSRLPFFTSLLPMGINAVSVDKGLPEEKVLQLDQLIHRQKAEQMPKGQIRIENPELHLTSLYLAQELRKEADSSGRRSEELKEMNEELAAHFCRGKYIIAVEEGKGIPLLKRDEDSYQPIFTDIREFQKFNQKKEYGAAVIEYEKIKEILTPETKGVAVNPFGANILLKIR